ncbi:putative nucleoside diphosphate kinase [Dictyocaulus viviparus]|uniref:nucleoside-diphosphate kinase n=1 Tax=Dictyocaulus viviparus TaxID=29172 RepID=A0A0D8Y6F4_DICVI|nr:putative nucleoside diphosphate kinase [Dictyocaulus viviparus]
MYRNTMSHHLIDGDVIDYSVSQVVLCEFINAGVVIGGARKLQMTSDKAEQLYEAHRGKYFFRRIVRHMTSGPVIVMCVNGDVRRILGSSQLYPLPNDDEFVNVRQRYALSSVRNVAHTSDVEAASRELALFEPYPPPHLLLNEILS